MVRDPKRLPPEPDAPLIHSRSYDVKAYRESATQLRLRGIVHDEKPAGIYFADDPEPLTIHYMVVDLVLDFPSLEIVRAEVVMDTTPHSTCLDIEETYQKLVGLSIARGFSRHVKDLFGGPLGCTHIGALLQAMAPVAVQSMWSMQAAANAAQAEEGTAVSVGEDAVAKGRASDADFARKRAMRFNLNTCHMWAEDGPLITNINAGGELEPPVWAVDRLAKLGRDPDEWVRGGMGIKKDE